MSTRTTQPSAEAPANRGAGGAAGAGGAPARPDVVRPHSTRPLDVRPRQRLGARQLLLGKERGAALDRGGRRKGETERLVLREPGLRGERGGESGPRNGDPRTRTHEPRATGTARNSRGHGLLPPPRPLRPL